MLFCRFCGDATVGHSTGCPRTPAQIRFWTNGFIDGRSGRQIEIFGQISFWKLGYEQGLRDRNQNQPSIPQIEAQFGPVYQICLN